MRDIKCFVGDLHSHRELVFHAFQHLTLKFTEQLVVSRKYGKI